MEEPDILERPRYRPRFRRRRYVPILQDRMSEIENLREALNTTERECERRHDLIRDYNNKISTLKHTIRTLRTRIEKSKEAGTIRTHRSLPNHIADRLWNQRGKGIQCSTCYEDIEKRQDYVVTGCGHEFCSSCIGQWLERSNTCPSCRETLHSF